MLARLVPLYLGLAAPAAVVFGPNGMAPADLMQDIRGSLGVRAALWVSWLVVSWPVAQAVLDARWSLYLRWLPAARHVTVLAVAALLISVQSAWALLWWTGAGPGEAITAATVAAAIHAVGLTAPRTRVEALIRWLGLALGLSGAIAVPQWAPWVTWWPIALVVAAVALPLAVSAAWARAPEYRRQRRWMPRSRRPSVLLAQRYLSGLARTRLGLLIRCGLVVALGAALTQLIGAANGFGAAELATFSVGVALVTLSACAAGITGPVVDAEQGLAWLLTSMDVRAQVRVRARSLALGVVGAGLGCAHGLLASWSLGVTDMAYFTGSGTLLGLGLCVLAGRAGAWSLTTVNAHGRITHQAGSDRPPPQPLATRAGPVLSRVDGGRVIAAVIGLLIASLVLLSLIGEAVVLLIASAGLIVAGGER